MRRGRFIALSVLLDAILINAGLVLAFFVRFGGQLPAFNFNAYLATAPLITVIYLVGGYIYGLYEPERTENPWAVVRAVLSAVTLGAALTAAVLFFGGLRFASFSRLAIVFSWFFHVGLLVGWRLSFLRISTVTWPEQHVLLVGTGPLARELAGELRARGKWGYRVVGFLSDTDACEGESPGGPVDGLPVFGGPHEASRVVSEQRVDRVIIVSPIALRELIESLVIAEEAAVRVDVVPELYEVFIGTVDSMVADIPLMEITRQTVPPWFAAAKRLLDLSFALVLLVVLSPVMLVAAAAILIAMGRPVVFVQERVGKDMKPFDIVKFRTMVRDAERDTGPVLATDSDERITPLGNLLRRYRIDELPQLLNIIRGEMSFVGPRPERGYFVEQFAAEIPGYRERFKVKPGVTGLAQVSGGYATTPERKLKYDLIYMYHQNLPMDAQIVIETLRVVLTGRGAR